MSVYQSSAALEFSTQAGSFCDDGRLFRALIAVPLLQRANVDFIALQRGNAFSCGPGGCHRCDGGNAIRDGSAANSFFVEPWFSAMGRINDELHAVALNQVHHIGTAFFYFVDAVHSQPGAFQSISGAMRGYKAEAHLYKALRQFNGFLLVAINHANKDGA